MRAMRALILLAAVLVVASCGDTDSTETPPEPAPRRETVFDPLTSTIGRAQGVQQTVDEQAAEQRRRIDEAAR
jgi:hypothetical protein